MAKPPSRRSRPRRSGSLLRGWLALGVLAAAFATGLIDPAVPEPPWPEPEIFYPDAAMCTAAHSRRGWASLEVPGSRGLVTPAEVARKYNLEVPWLCAANDLLSPCDRKHLTVGERLWLPLAPKAVGPAREARLAGDREEDH